MRKKGREKLRKKDNRFKEKLIIRGNVMKMNWILGLMFLLMIRDRELIEVLQVVLVKILE